MQRNRSHNVIQPVAPAFSIAWYLVVFGIWVFHNKYISLPALISTPFLLYVIPLRWVYSTLEMLGEG